MKSQKLCGQAKVQVAGEKLNQMHLNSSHKWSRGRQIVQLNMTTIVSKVKWTNQNRTVPNLISASMRRPNTRENRGNSNMEIITQTITKWNMDFTRWQVHKKITRGKANRIRWNLKCKIMGINNRVMINNTSNRTMVNNTTNSRTMDSSISNRTLANQSINNVSNLGWIQDQLLALVQ